MSPIHAKSPWGNKFVQTWHILMCLQIVWIENMQGKYHHVSEIQGGCCKTTHFYLVVWPRIPESKWFLSWNLWLLTNLLSSYLKTYTEPTLTGVGNHLCHCGRMRMSLTDRKFQLLQFLGFKIAKIWHVQEELAGSIRNVTIAIRWNQPWTVRSCQCNNRLFGVMGGGYAMSIVLAIGVWHGATSRWWVDCRKQYRTFGVVYIGLPLDPSNPSMLSFSANIFTCEWKTSTMMNQSPWQPLKGRGCPLGLETPYAGPWFSWVVFCA